MYQDREREADDAEISDYFNKRREAEKRSRENCHNAVEADYLNNKVRSALVKIISLNNKKIEKNRKEINQIINELLLHWK